MMDRKVKKKLKRRLLFDVAYTYRRYAVDLFYLQSAKEWKKGQTLIDVGGKRALKKGDFVIEDYIEKPIYVNIDPEVKPDYVCDAAHMPFEDEFADELICSEVIEHVEDPIPVLKEMKRVLKVGGRLYICVPFSMHMHGQPFDFGRYTEMWWEAKIKELGFKLISLKRQGGYFATRLNMNKRYFKMIRRKNRKNPFLLFPYLYFVLANSLLLFLDEHSKEKGDYGYTTGYEIVLEK